MGAVEGWGLGVYGSNLDYDLLNTDELTNGQIYFILYRGRKMSSRDKHSQTDTSISDKTK